MSRNLERFVRSIILAVRLFHFPFIPESVLPLYLCVALSRSVHFLFERQRSPSRHLWRVGVQRLVGFYFSSAVLGFAFPNRFRAVRDLCLSVVEGL